MNVVSTGRAIPVPDSTRFRRLRYVAAIGDVLVFVVFALSGEHAHRIDHAALALAGVAAPFLIGWFAAGLGLGAFDRFAIRDRRASVHRVVRSWFVGCAITMGIRSTVAEHLMPVSFIAVAFVFNLVLLLLWRFALAASVAYAAKRGGESRRRASATPGSRGSTEYV